jgi:hypothetical protein
MNRWAVTFCVVMLGMGIASAAELLNGSFEIDFGQRANMNMWGDYGEVWGEAYQVTAGSAHYAKKANTGERMLLINVPTGSWGGIWQQIPWDANVSFAWEAFYLIDGGDLPADCATFMKVEFYNGNNAKIGELNGKKRTDSTKGKWIRDSMSGKTPIGTEAIRFVLLAGSNPDDKGVEDRIYWDDARITE